MTEGKQQRDGCLAHQRIESEVEECKRNIDKLWRATDAMKKWIIGLLTAIIVGIAINTALNLKQVEKETTQVKALAQEIAKELNDRGATIDNR